MPLMVKLPCSVSNYMSTLARDTHKCGYVCGYIRLDAYQVVVESGGHLLCDQSLQISVNRPVHEQVCFLEGLLPSGDEPVVIANAQLSADQFVDIHLFIDGEDQWVVILDNTENAIAVQKRQQVRLSKSILTGKLVESNVLT